MPYNIFPTYPNCDASYKHSKKSSQDNLTCKDGPPTSVATKPGCSAVLDALDHVEELEDKCEGIDEQVDGELEEDIEDSDLLSRTSKGRIQQKVWLRKRRNHQAKMHLS